MSNNFWSSLTKEISQLFEIQETEINKTEEMYDMFHNACKTGNVEMVQKYLKDGIDPSIPDNYAIQYACEIGHISIIDQLLQDSRVDPSADFNIVFQTACRYNHIDIVYLLLQDSRIDPFDLNNQAMLNASLYGDINVVERLLQEHPKYPLRKINMNHVIYYAREKGHTTIVNRLLQFV
jgi:ankyrin repeat protein